MEIPYTFEEYVYARGQHYSRISAPTSIRHAHYALARLDARSIFDKDEQQHYTAAQIHAFERLYGFNELLPIAPKRPEGLPPSVANAEMARQAPEAAGEEKTRADRALMPPPPLPSRLPGTADQRPVLPPGAVTSGSSANQLPSFIRAPGGVISFAGRGTNVPIKLPPSKKRSNTTQKAPRSPSPPPPPPPPPPPSFSGAGKGVQLPIIAGDALPTNERQARTITRIRRQQLEALVKAHKAAEAKKARGIAKKRSKQQASEIADTDLMPEFFDIDKDDEDAIRCACGCTEDDGEKMIACNTCNVWQHNECMGDAVPEDLEHGEYTCHQCDPWNHRKLIAKLRRQSKFRA